MEYDAFRKEMEERGRQYYQEEQREGLSGQDWISILIIIGLIVYSLV